MRNAAYSTRNSIYSTMDKANSWVHDHPVRTAGAALGAYSAYRGLKHFVKNYKTPAQKRNEKIGLADGGALAALGAGVVVSKILKHLRKNKKQNKPWYK